MKQVWVNAATCSVTASTTRGALLPTVVTAMPEPRSMNRLPSTSSTIPPAARVAKTGIVVATPALTAACLRFISSTERGPGTAVARWRDCSRSLLMRQACRRADLRSKTCSALLSCPMSMDLRLLRYFVATADAGSATRAAAELHVTQPVLSRQLRQLEHQLGLRLFERDGRRLRMTAAAEDFLGGARALLSQADQLERAAESLASGTLSALHLAAPTTTLTDVLAPFLATLRADDPTPMVRELDPRGTVAALRAGADLAVVTRPPSRAVASRPLAVLPVWA